MAVSNEFTTVLPIGGRYNRQGVEDFVGQHKPQGPRDREWIETPSPANRTVIINPGNRCRVRGRGGQPRMPQRSP